MNKSLPLALLVGDAVPVFAGLIARLPGLVIRVSFLASWRRAKRLDRLPAYE